MPLYLCPICSICACIRQVKDQQPTVLVCAAIDDEFDEEEAEAVDWTESQSAALETITIDDDGAVAFGGAASGDARGGFMQPDFDPFDPKAWAEREPGLFAGVNGDPETQDSAGLPAVEEIAISGALDVSGSLQRVQSQPSPRPVRQQPASPSPLARQPLSSAVASPAARPAAVSTSAVPAVDSDSDDDNAQLDARAALYTLGMPEPQEALPTAAVPSQLAGGLQPFATAADQAAGPSPGLSAPAAQGSPSIVGADEEDPVPVGVVVYEFEAMEEGELTVQEGEEVYLLGYVDGGWAQVQLLATGEVGNVPEWAVQEVDAQLVGQAASGAIAPAASVSQAISDADSALLRATSTPRPAPQPGTVVAARMSVDGPRHRRMASSATVFSDVATPARASTIGVDDNPFTGGGQGGGDDILGLFDAGEGGDAGDTADIPGVETADPFGLDGLFMTDQGNTLPLGVNGAAGDAAVEGNSAAHFERSAPALDPGLVAASGQGSVTAASTASAVASVDNPFLSAAAATGSVETADIPTSSDNPFGQG